MLKVGLCPGSKRFMNSVEDVAEFEKMYSPIWESEAWKREHGSSLSEDGDALDQQAIRNEDEKACVK